MTESDDLVPDRGAHDLDLAAQQLRGLPPSLPVEVADRALERALATPRPAQLVRAGDPDEGLRISTVALVALLRERLDTSLAHASVRRVRCVASRDERLEEVAVELIVAYGQDLREVAARARALLRTALDAALGPAAVGATLVLEHVHVSDVTVGDPHLVDPGDET